MSGCNVTPPWHLPATARFMVVLEDASPNDTTHVYRPASVGNTFSFVIVQMPSMHGAMKQ